MTFCYYDICPVIMTVMTLTSTAYRYSNFSEKNRVKFPIVVVNTISDVLETKILLREFGIFYLCLFLRDIKR